MKKIKWHGTVNAAIEWIVDNDRADENAQPAVLVKYPTVQLVAHTFNLTPTFVASVVYTRRNC